MNGGIRADTRRGRELLALAASIQSAARDLGVSNKAAVPSVDEATPASVSTFDAMVRNAQIKKAAHKLYGDGYYARAVEEAFKALNNLVKRRSGLRDADGDGLMRTALSAKAPVLRLNKGITQSELDEQAGYMDIFAGSIKGIRNPRAHDHELEDDPVTALELLTLASHLADKAEAGKKQRSRKTSS